MARSFDRRLPTALGLVLLAALVRLHPFLEGNDDGDIGVYVLSARAWLHGALPYTTIWEYKPPGLFALYAAALFALGDGSRASAALGLLASAATTLILWRLVARLVPGGERAGVLAAILWACTSVENDGLLGDAELLTVPFAAAALLALARPSRGAALTAGLLAACVVQMKLSAAVFVALPLALAARRGGASLAAFGLGFCAPPALEAGLYALAHRFDALWDANAGATVRRLRSRADLPFPPAGLVTHLRALAPGLVLAPLASPLRRTAGVLIVAAWLALAALTVIAVGEYDARQLVPLAAPLAALGGIGLDALARRVRFERTLVAVALALTFALHGYFEFYSALRMLWVREVIGVHDWRSSEGDRIVQHLGPLRVRGGVWFVEVTPLLYDRLGIAPPTRYPLTSNLLNRRLWPMLGRRGDDELERIVERERPAWIVMRPCGPWCDPPTRDRLVARIRARYRPVAALEDRATLYRRAAR